jgi:hypothetical protein
MPLSDQKRLVRKLHYEHAMRALRARDHAFNKLWHFLTISGPCPAEEIGCIRGFFTQAHITSVDIEQDRVNAAIDAGADDVICCDLSNFQIIHSAHNVEYLPPPQIGTERKYDVICLDLQGHATVTLRDLIKVYWKKILAPRGVMMVTMSIGHDVVDAYNYEWNRAHEELKELRNKKYYSPHDNANERAIFQLERLYKDDIPEEILKRLHFALKERSEFLSSVLHYTGNKIPMLSCALIKEPQGIYLSPRYEKVTKQDFALALATPFDPTKVFGCPQDQIAHARNTMAAYKAVATKRARTAAASNGHAASKPSSNYRNWSDKELDLLRAEYGKPNCNPEQLAAAMGRRIGALYQKAFSMGLHRRDQRE